MAEIKQNEFHEKLQLILEFFNKNGENSGIRFLEKYQDHYVIHIKKKEIQGQEEENERIRTKLNKMGREIKEKFISVEANQKNLQDKFLSMEKMQKEILEELKKLSEPVGEKHSFAGIERSSTMALDKGSVLKTN